MSSWSVISLRVPPTFCQEKGMILDPKKSLRMELKSSVLGQEQMRPVLSYIVFLLGKEDRTEQSASYIWYIIHIIYSCSLRQCMTMIDIHDPLCIFVCTAYKTQICAVCEYNPHTSHRAQRKYAQSVCCIHISTHIGTFICNYIIHATFLIHPFLHRVVSPLIM